MKNNFKILLITAFLLFFSLCFVALTSAELLEGHFEYSYNGQTIVNNDWVLNTEMGILTINSKAGIWDWNETGTGQKGYEGSWYEYKDLIKKVVLNGNFKKISNYAFSGCTNLLEVVITSDIVQIDGYAFEGCTSLHSIYFGSDVRHNGMAYLPNISVISPGILKGTAIKYVCLSPDISSIDESGLPSGLTRIFGTKETLAESYANSKGIDFVDTGDKHAVKIYIDGSLYKEYNYFDEEVFTEQFFEYNGKIYTVFKDKDCKIHYDNTTRIKGSFSLYAKPILSFSGFSVRIADYKGLRSIFEYDNIDLNGSMKISGVGAIIGHTAYALDEFNMEERLVTKVPVYEDGAMVGRLLSNPRGSKESFAVTIVGFEGTEEKFAERALKNTVFRGYVTIFDESNQSTYILYTDAVGNSLRGASEDYLNRFPASNYNQYKFVEETVIATESYCNEVRYNKYQLLDLVTEVYNDSEKLIVGEEIDYNKMPHDVLDTFYEETGEYPSILGMDLACYGMNLVYNTVEYRDSFIKELIDYCRAGGIITVSSHFQNPAGSTTGYCRGYLGKEDEFKELITEGTELNVILKHELEVDAEFLRLLGNNSIPVLWRPFHEMNGSWFWWCIEQENGYLLQSEAFVDLWKYVYDYYVNELGLTNLIWVYSPNNGNVDVSYCYPGDDYVDMVGIDWYSSGNYEISNSYKRIMSYDMPVALTEYGSNGNLNALESYSDFMRMYDDGMKIAYVLTWCYGSKQDFTNAGNAAELMEMSDTLSRDELFKLIKEKSLSGNFGDNLYYKVTKNEGEKTYSLNISGEGNGIDSSSLNGKRAPWSYYSDEITKILFDDNIGYIGEKSVNSLPELKTVIIRNSEAVIDKNAFESTNITTVYGFYCSTAEAFAEDNGLEFKNINDIMRIAGGYLYEEWQDAAVVSTYWYYDKATKILSFVSDMSGWNETGVIDYATDGKGWSDYIDEIEKVVIGDGLRKISQSAFMNHTALKTVELSSDIVQIDSNAFNGCSALDTIYVRGNAPVKGVADLHKISTLGTQPDVFVNCAFDTVILGSEVTSILDGIFSGTPVMTVIGNSSHIAELAKKLNASAVTGYVDGNTVWTIAEDILTVYAMSIPAPVESWADYANTVTKIVFESDSHINSLNTGVFDGFTNLSEILFKCNAPIKVSEYCFGQGNPTVYFAQGITSFTSPSWNGYSCLEEGSVS